MIIKQYVAVIRKLKTQTRRTSEKDTYKVGSIQSVVPKRAWPTVYYQWLNGELKIWHEFHANTKPMQFGLEKYYTPLKVHILNKYWEPLQNITEEDAIAEGIYPVYSPNTTTHTRYKHDLSDTLYLTAVEAYSCLWDSINGKSKQFCWAANPSVCVHKFELYEEK